LDTENIQNVIRGKYAEVSKTAVNKFNYPTGKEGAILQGYDHILVKNMPDDLIESFCGVGNPFTLGSINLGEIVLDVGCGAGFDLIVASGKVGQNGKVCGIDLRLKWQKAKII
jgi:2-polyprenyl-3-methyl-5-hydroxy-6-metoxy-1,4-benzoquinol methylase